MRSLESKENLTGFLTDQVIKIAGQDVPARHVLNTVYMLQHLVQTQDFVALGALFNAAKGMSKPKTSLAVKGALSPVEHEFFEGDSYVLTDDTERVIKAVLEPSVTNATYHVDTSAFKHKFNEFAAKDAERVGKVHQKLEEFKERFSGDFHTLFEQLDFDTPMLSPESARFLSRAGLLEGRGLSDLAIEVLLTGFEKDAERQSISPYGPFDPALLFEKE